MTKYKFTIGQILTAGAVAFLIVLAAVGGSGLRVANGVVGSLDSVVEVTAKANETAGRMLFNESDLQSMTRRAVVAAARRDGQTVADEVTESRQQLAELREQVRSVQTSTGSPEAALAARKFGEVVDKWATAAEQVWTLAGEFKFEEAVTAEHGLDAYSDEAEKLATQVFDAEVAQMQVEKARAHALATSGLVLLGVAIGVGCLVAIGWFLAIRRINQTLRTTAIGLRDNSSQVVSAAAQVASSAQSLAQGASEQSSSLEQTSGAMSRMSQMTGQTAENAGRVAQLMGEVDSRVSESNHSLEAMVSSMSAINDRSQKVAHIIKTIDEIAFQTNILALNAAVEAARAGEAGMGFAVVADEVRSLAQRSAQAAHDTAALIEDSLSSARDGSNSVGQLTAAFDGIKRSVDQVRQLVVQVSEASREQARGLEQVSDSLTQLEKVTQAAAATAEESAAASEELNAQAEGSLERVRELDALVERQPGLVTAPRPRRATTVVPWKPRTSKASAVSSASAVHDSDDESLGTGTFGRF